MQILREAHQQVNTAVQQEAANACPGGQDWPISCFHK